MIDKIHSCSYYCHIPACIKAQRDELRDKFVESLTRIEEPVSVPQDVEKFIAEKQRHNSSLNHNAIHTDDLRAWMAGHARVPVGDGE